MKAASEEFASNLAPDGDWNPVLIVFHEGQAHMTSFQMPPNGDKRESLFMEMIPNYIQKKFPNPDAVVMVVSAWYLENKDGKPWEPGDILPADSPDRKECLVLQGINSEKEISCMGKIIRSESSPKLEWVEEVESGVFEGRLVGGLRRAVWT